jgi:hypothetical protein
MRTLLKMTALAAVCMALAAAGGSALADQVPGADTFQDSRFSTNVDQGGANAARERIESGQQPGWKGPVSIVPGDGPGLMHVNAQQVQITPRSLSKVLTPPGANQRGRDVHTATLIPGAKYVIELKSGTGATRTTNNETRALPGFFDPVLSVEDGVPGGTQLRDGGNDDVDWPRNCNSRVTITAPPSGQVRIVVTSFHEGESGPYTIEIHE